MSLIIGQVKKWPSPIIKFHSNFESSCQTEYTGNFSGQSECSSFFYRTRKVDEIIIIKKCFLFCHIITVWPQSWTGSTKKILYKILSDSRGHMEVYQGSIAKNRFLVLNFGSFFRPCPICPIFRGHLKCKLQQPY